MKLLLSHSEVSFTKTALTIGNFDGVHLGHQTLLAQLKKVAKQEDLPVVLLLFEPQPNEFFLKTKAPLRLSPLRDKLLMLAQCGVDYVYCLRFNERLASMSAGTFAEKYIFSLLRAKYLLLGNDFRFGKNREGDVGFLRESAKAKQCSIEIFPDFKKDELRVSSTKIRQLLAANQLPLIASLLGRPYALSGRIVRGEGQGRKWGIPTANLFVKTNTLALAGVFSVSVQRKGSEVCYGVANVGYRPTLNGQEKRIEIHLFDLDDNLYGEHLTVNFLHKIRDEIKFDSVDSLIQQIQNDIRQAKKFCLSNEE